MTKLKKATASAVKSSSVAKTYSVVGRHYCTLIKTVPREFPPDVSDGRARMIRLVDKKWVNGIVLKYYFFKGSADGSPNSWKGSPQQKNTVVQAFDAWKNLDLGLGFEETSDKHEAEVRIGFMNGDGSWSYVGRDIIDIASSPDERTMNFGWDISNDLDTAIHEIGHTLGLPHEHQNPFAGIVWDEEKVYTDLAGSPNYWDRDTTYHNIIRKLPPSEVEGSNHDPDSVMHYPFGPGLILEPARYRNGVNPPGGLSAKDKEYARKFYPPLKPGDYKSLTVQQSVSLKIKAGEQKNFTFTPTRSQKYTIETFGTADTLMVLFERNAGEEVYLAGDDDSGENFNSKINIRLIKGREYVIRLRLFFVNAEGSLSLMVY